MKKALTLTLLAASLGALSASAQHYYEGLHTGTYLSVRSAFTLAGNATLKAGGASGDLGLKNGYDVSIAGGYRIMMDEIHSFKFLETRLPWALRFEVEGGYGTNDLKVSGVNGDLDSYRLMGNIMLDIPLTDMFYVSLGGGIGGIHSKLSASVPGFAGSSGSDTAFVYQGGVVLGAQLNDYWSVELSYRALSYTDLDLGNGTRLEAPLINMLGIGVSVQF